MCGAGWCFLLRARTYGSSRNSRLSTDRTIRSTTTISGRARLIYLAALLALCTPCPVSSSLEPRSSPVLSRTRSPTRHLSSFIFYPFCLGSFKSHLHELASDSGLEGILDFHTAEHSTAGVDEPIYWIVLSNKARPHTLSFTEGQTPTRIKKPKLFITFGEHAREFVTVESFFDLFLNLTEGWKMPSHTPAGHYSRLTSLF